MVRRATIGWALTNVGGREVANRLVEAILGERLAACANMHAIESVYWWKDKRRRANEIQVLFKTSAHKLPRLVARVRELHPYEVPYLAWGEGERVLPAYAAWVSAQTRKRLSRGPRRRPRRGTGRAGCQGKR